MAQRSTRDVTACFDAVRVESLLNCWRQEQRRHFVVWSGFWLPILDQYRDLVKPDVVEVDHCRIDAIVSASFRAPRSWRPGDREVWFWNFTEGRIDHEIPVLTTKPPTPYANRPRRLVVHGGGWGMGTYQKKIPQLSGRGFDLDIVAYEAGDIVGRADSHRMFRVEPGFAPWEPRADGYVFPPFGEIRDDETPTFDHLESRHGLFDVIAESRAIVSKPGGGTLIDSLASATPVVLLEPFGDAEEKNGELWRQLGFGIGYDQWAESGFDTSTLAQLQANIRRRHVAPSYPEALARRSLRGSTT